MIPNLVDLVNQDMQHEQEVLTKITKLRSMQFSDEISSEKLNMQSELSNSIKTVFAQVENYPDTTTVTIAV